MDKCFFYRPRMAKVLRETVARQLRRDDFKLGSEGRKEWLNHYEETLKKAA
jgi:hypothetical protein